MKAVDNFTLEVESEEFMSILGPSGCGKTTLLRLVAGLETPSEGRILFDGKVVNDIPPRDRNVTLVFQSYALFPHMTVAENIGFPLSIRKVSKEKVAECVRGVTDLLKIGSLLNRKPRELSGGEQQRVALGRAIVRKPDVLLMDITMHRMGGIEATQLIKREMPDIKVVALTVHEDEAHLRRFLEAGASGYVPKKAADVQLLEAIRVVNRGEAYLHPSQASILVESIKRGENLAAAGQDELDILSPRERKVLELIAQGYTNQEAAEKLFLSVKTVETYKARLMEKLNLKSRADLIKYALQKGILTSMASSEQDRSL
ncbi:MAG: ATP-binding cassette domain-containing protein [Deltaproteobacteria bacterium]